MAKHKVCSCGGSSYELECRIKSKAHRRLYVEKDSMSEDLTGTESYWLRKKFDKTDKEVMMTSISVGDKIVFNGLSVGYVPRYMIGEIATVTYKWKTHVVTKWVGMSQISTVVADAVWEDRPLTVKLDSPVGRFGVGQEWRVPASCVENEDDGWAWRWFKADKEVMMTSISVGDKIVFKDIPQNERNRGRVGYCDNWPSYMIGEIATVTGKGSRKLEVKPDSPCGPYGNRRTVMVRPSCVEKADKEADKEQTLQVWDTHRHHQSRSLV